MKKTALILSFLSLLSACDQMFKDTKENEKSDLTLDKIHLIRFNSCAEIDKARKYPDNYYQDNVAFDGASAAPVSSDASSAPSGGTGETNVQVDGVDEMDTSKADDNFVYHLENSKLIVIKRTPVSEAAVIQRVDLQFEGTYMASSGLFISETKLVALGTNYNQTSVATYRRNSDGSVSFEGVRLLDGYLQAARKIGDRLHLVVSSYVGYWYANGTGAINSALPTSKYQNSDALSLADCSDIYHEPAAADPAYWTSPVINSLVGVVSLRIDKPDQKPEGEFIAANNGSIIYSSKENLFISSYGWTGETPIHQFRLADGDSKTAYVGSFLAKGELLNQFSMDEYKGHFRVATTTHTGSGKADTVNQLMVLKLQDGDPELVGAIEDIAAGERIYSVRFMGKVGYLVTFKKVDPLFTIDLSDPTDPKIRGQLKIPGFSSYLHPMKEGYLLAIGKDAEAALESADFAWYQGMAMSIFDVRDIDNPKLVQKIGIGSRGTDSETLYDHKAYRYIPEEEMVVIPLSLYENGGGQNDYGEYQYSGFQIYKATVENGFELVGVSKFAEQCGSGSYYYCYGSNAGRSYYRDGAITMLGGGEAVFRNASSPDTDEKRFDL